MILRRFMKHVSDQNWFAVGLDVCVVIVGIFLGMQVTEWNEERKNKAAEQAVLLQLEKEFTEIRNSLERQIAVRTIWTEHMYVLVEAIENGSVEVSEVAVKLGLSAASAAGRQVPQSATFLQLMSGEGLSGLSDDQLRLALMRYDARLKRDAFIHQKLLDLVLVELSGNIYVDRNILTDARYSAQIDRDPDRYIEVAIAGFRSYDFDGLMKNETHYEAIYRMHVLQLTVEETMLALAGEVLQQISAGIMP